MSDPIESHAPQPSPSPEEKDDFKKIVYKEIFENSRYYDAHVWQIPSVTIAVNAFLIGQAFSDSVQNVCVRALVVLSASFFTFVLLIALVKHRLHKSAQDQNIRQIEESFNLEDKFHHIYKFPEELDDVEKKPNVFEKLLAPRSARTWLMSVMGLTILTDLVILAGILLSRW